MISNQYTLLTLIAIATVQASPIGISSSSLGIGQAGHGTLSPAFSWPGFKDFDLSELINPSTGKYYTPQGYEDKHCTRSNNGNGFGIIWHRRESTNNRRPSGFWPSPVTINDGDFSWPGFPVGFPNSKSPPGLPSSIIWTLPSFYTPDFNDGDCKNFFDGNVWGRTCHSSSSSSSNIYDHIYPFNNHKYVNNLIKNANLESPSNSKESMTKIDIKASAPNKSASSEN